MSRAEASVCIAFEAIDFVETYGDECVWDGACADQLRSLVTSYAILGEHEADTLSMDLLIDKLFYELSSRIDEFDMPYEDFYCDMIKYIV